jgi:hypothetical protein
MSSDNGQIKRISIAVEIILTHQDPDFVIPVANNQSITGSIDENNPDTTKIKLYIISFTLRKELYQYTKTKDQINFTTSLSTKDILQNDQITVIEIPTNAILFFPHEYFVYDGENSVDPNMAIVLLSQTQFDESSSHWKGNWKEKKEKKKKGFLYNFFHGLSSNAVYIAVFITLVLVVLLIAWGVIQFGIRRKRRREGL